MILKDNLYTLDGVTQTAGATEYAVTLRADSPVYAAHFPGRPVTPGVCIVQTAVELLEAHLGQKCSLVRVKNAKFLTPLTPHDTPRVTYRLRRMAESADAGEVSAQWEVTQGARVLSKLSFTCKKND